MKFQSTPGFVSLISLASALTCFAAAETPPTAELPNPLPNNQSESVDENFDPKAHEALEDLLRDADAIVEFTGDRTPGLSTPKYSRKEISSLQEIRAKLLKTAKR